MRGIGLLQNCKDRAQEGHMIAHVTRSRVQKPMAHHGRTWRITTLHESEARGGGGERFTPEACCCSTRFLLPWRKRKRRTFCRSASRTDAEGTGSGPPWRSVRNVCFLCQAFTDVATVEPDFFKAGAFEASLWSGGAFAALGAATADDGACQVHGNRSANP